MTLISLGLVQFSSELYTTSRTKIEFIIVLIAALLVLETSSLEISDQQQELQKPQTQPILERVKRQVQRGCGCGSTGCSCQLIASDLRVFLTNNQIDELRRSRTGGCRDGAEGQICTTSYRNGLFTTLLDDDQLQILQNTVRGFPVTQLNG